MKILIFSPSFLPVLGGLENMMDFLARGLSELGVEVIVITLVGNKPIADNIETTPYKTVRNPSIFQFYNYYKECDAYLNFNISLKGLWPLFFKRKPFFVSHQITYTNIDGSIDLLERIKRYIAKFSINIYCSEFVKDSLNFNKGCVIGNCYNDHLFKNLSKQREFDIVFVGRLVSDKGVDTLVNALHLLKKNDHLCPSLTIIGTGPELENLKNIVFSLNLNHQIIFSGKHIGQSLVNLLNQHKLMVVPSKWKEPFGIVALEGLACGCDLMVSQNGGLIEASGKQSLNFQNGDIESLYFQLKTYFTSKNTLFDKSSVETHLKSHSILSTSKKYLEFIKKHTS
ncbi:glycosyltransferase family 4 protein [Pedobacter cryophilus]|uniref:Glycosyltransferase family 4 protein n=1 Tax=Pedobacter cryophilus TaxID=2571271 RepID=A0A4U1C2T5_9SPHI|nr:glycosyltransferase family 4 protein [Pedobacter cryophilus]TKB98616.1 glycosyltransferase family 4 protein [Pedobacter cryophilus]